MEIMLYITRGKEPMTPILRDYASPSVALGEYLRLIKNSYIGNIFITKDGKPISLDELKILNLLTR